MVNKKFAISGLMMVIILAALLVACEMEEAEPSPERQESQLLKDTQQGFISNQPVPKVDYSVERENVIKRIERWNNPNKISYIYLLSDMGTIVAYFPIKGKVTSLNTYATPVHQIVEDPYIQYTSNGGYSGAGQVVDAPDELGTYGENNSGIFFFLTDDTYMEWAGNYLLSDNPIKLTQQPIMVYEETGE